MRYEINISKDGYHLLATGNRSVRSKEELERVYKILQEKFTASEGYKLDVVEFTENGKVVDMGKTKIFKALTGEFVVQYK